MEQAVVDGVSLAYRITGTGAPVVFIHGACIADSYRPLITEESLAGRYRLISYCRRGYEGSSRPAGRLSIAEQAADCRALLRFLGVEKAHVVGHSFGGSVALQLTLDTPALVHSLALLEPALLVGESAEAYRGSLERGIQRYREVDATVVLDEMLQARWPAYTAGLEAALPGAFAQAVADVAAPFETELPALLDWDFGEEQARRISQPVLSVVGARSDALSPRFGEANRWLLSHLPKVESYVLPNAHHFLQIENPEAMATALSAFFARNPLST